MHTRPCYGMLGYVRTAITSITIPYLLNSGAEPRNPELGDDRSANNWAHKILSLTLFPTSVVSNVLE